MYRIQIIISIIIIDFCYSFRAFIFHLTKARMLNTVIKYSYTKLLLRRNVFEQDGLLHSEQRQAVLYPTLQATLYHAGKLRRGLRR